MDWSRLLSTKRLGMEAFETAERADDRTQFQRDYDRLIFSSPFRRMQNKTQVFPLPEHIFVHNRLTHSLEVASVGRSMGNLLAAKLSVESSGIPLLEETGTIVATSCLAHDLGNPPFGHSGEAAISGFFTRGPGNEYRTALNDAEWSDFTQFDGNANAFRVLTHQFNGKREGGFALTYSTLAGIVKYPYESLLTSKQKFGFFQTEKETYKKIALELGIRKSEAIPGSYVRHPLVYLVEAADDICYQIMDLEDAFKLGILSYDEITGLYFGFYDPEIDQKRLHNIKQTLSRIKDLNEQIGYLRSGVIGRLIQEGASLFFNHMQEILQGRFLGSLMGRLPEHQAEAMKTVKRVSFSKVYAHRSVVEIEIAGYRIIGTLLEEFVGAMMNPKELYSRKILSLLPEQYKTDSDSVYLRIQSAVDFVSGMTDQFALDLYRKIKGISLPGVV